MQATMTVGEFLGALPTAFDLYASGHVNGNAVAKQIRDDLKAAVKAGLLPKGIKLSVRQNSGAYYSSAVGSLRVSISTWSGAVYADCYVEAVLAGDRFNARVTRDRYSPEFAAALELIEKIADRHNFDRSRSEEDYFHVGYYLNVDGGKAESAAADGLRAERALHVQKLAA